MFIAHLFHTYSEWTLIWPMRAYYMQATVRIAGSLLCRGSLPSEQVVQAPSLHCLAACEWCPLKLCNMVALGGPMVKHEAVW